MLPLHPSSLFGIIKWKSCTGFSCIFVQAKNQNDEKLNVIVFENVLINMKIQTWYLSKYTVINMSVN